MKLLNTALVACALAMPVIASAQWQWVDSQGRKVFSDQPPPLDVPEKNILRRPHGRHSAAAAPAASETAPTSPPPADKAAGVDKELEEKTRKAEEAEKAKRAAEAKKAAQAKADSCSQARQGKATIDSGMRMARVNDKGEREILDDDARAAEQQRLQSIIDSNCQ
ncbi:MAG: DUF4124 domain-containing protein [Xenophilus sp.]